MKATPVTALPEGPEWIYEVKWDGYRALAAKHGEDVQLLSLKNKNLAWDFPAVVTAVRTIKAHTALLDGEIVAVNAEGQPSFRPKLVAQIGFTEWTTSGMLRHATFMGLRDDKAPTEVIREV